MKACRTTDALFTDNVTSFILSETEGTDRDRGNAIITPAQVTIPYNPQTTPQQIPVQKKSTQTYSYLTQNTKHLL